MKKADIQIGEHYAWASGPSNHLRYSNVRQVKVLGFETVNVARYSWKTPRNVTRVRVEFVDSSSVSTLIETRYIFEPWAAYEKRAQKRRAEREAKQAEEDRIGDLCFLTLTKIAEVTGVVLANREYAPLYNTRAGGLAVPVLVTDLEKLNAWIDEHAK